MSGRQVILIDGRARTDGDHLPFQGAPADRLCRPATTSASPGRARPLSTAAGPPISYSPAAFPPPWYRTVARPTVAQCIAAGISPHLSADTMPQGPQRLKELLEHGQQQGGEQIYPICTAQSVITEFDLAAQIGGSVRLPNLGPITLREATSPACRFLPNICSFSCLGVARLPSAYQPVMEGRLSASRKPASSFCQGIRCDFWVKPRPPQ